MKEPRTPSSKAEMFRLYETGVFGNKLRTWHNTAAVNGYRGTVTLRYAGRTGGAWAAYEVRPENMDAVVESWVAEGADRGLVRVNESAPDDNLLIQGEVTRSGYWRGMALSYSHAKTKMRDAMRMPRVAFGLRAEIILRTLLSPSSYSDMDALLDVYPAGVVEFSTYSHSVGEIGGRNTVIWEVRDY